VADEPYEESIARALDARALQFGLRAEGLLLFVFLLLASAVAGFFLAPYLVTFDAGLVSQIAFTQNAREKFSQVAFKAQDSYVHLNKAGVDFQLVVIQPNIRYLSINDFKIILDIDKSTPPGAANSLLRTMAIAISNPNVSVTQLSLIEMA
jgi:hypothetical protein